MADAAVSGVIQPERSGERAGTVSPSRATLATPIDRFAIPLQNHCQSLSR